MWILRIQGRGPGGPGPFPSLSKGLDDRPPALSQGLDPALLVLLIVKGLWQEKCPNLNESTV